ncbi:MAG: hypothetical protein ACRC33_25955 [Gemmataceae bacterium]
MPLRDHFHEPVSDHLEWGSLLHAWAVTIETNLNLRWLPDQFVALNHIKLRASRENPTQTHDPISISLADGRTDKPGWEVPTPDAVIPRIQGDHVEVKVIDRRQVWADPAAFVVLVAPTNKETLAQRRAFLARCVSHLHQSAALVLIDIVTSLPHCLYNDLLTLLGAEGVPRLPLGTNTFAAAFRPVARGEPGRYGLPGTRLETDIWVSPVAVGRTLRTMPLRTIYDAFAPVEFEAAYEEVCRTRRIR